MGIPGEYDNPRIHDAYKRVASAIHKASKASGVVKSLGIGGLNSRVDLLTKLSVEDEYGVSRYIMSATDIVLLIVSIFFGRFGSSQAVY